MAKIRSRVLIRKGRVHPPLFMRSAAKCSGQMSAPRDVGGRSDAYVAADGILSRVAANVCREGKRPYANLLLGLGKRRSVQPLLCEERGHQIGNLLVVEIGEREVRVAPDTDVGQGMSVASPRCMLTFADKRYTIIGK